MEKIGRCCPQTLSQNLEATNYGYIGGNTVTNVDRGSGVKIHHVWRKTKKKTFVTLSNFAMSSPRVATSAKKCRKDLFFFLPCLCEVCPVCDDGPGHVCVVSAEWVSHVLPDVAARGERDAEHERQLGAVGGAAVQLQGGRGGEDVGGAGQGRRAEEQRSVSVAVPVDGGTTGLPCLPQANMPTLAKNFLCQDVKNLLFTDQWSHFKKKKTTILSTFYALFDLI